MRLPIVGALLGTLTLYGCKVGPNYKAPTVPAPPAYTESGHNGNWSSATPADGVDRGNWWTIYQDKELDELEQRCTTANQSIAAGLHAYEQAHDLVRENKSSLYPTVSIGASGSRNRISNNRPLRPTNASQYYWDF